MEKFLKRIKNSFMIMDSLFIIFGIVLLVWPKITGLIISYAFGSLLLVYGIVRAIQYFSKQDDGTHIRLELMIAVAAAGVGIFVLFKPDVVMSILPFVLGLAVFFDSISNVRKAFALKKMGYEKWWIAAIISGIMAVLGVLLFIKPFKAATAFIMFVGACLIVDGIADIWIVVTVMNAAKRKAVSAPVATVDADYVPYSDDSDTNNGNK